MSENQPGRAPVPQPEPGAGSAPATPRDP
ncbi:MAG: hypothetical protein MOP51_2282, partial [Citricoccus sp.]|nr:hypothetical protein [Citricoccus sp. WCRC_4]